MKDLKKEINKKVDKFLLTQEFGKYDSEIADALVPASVYTDADDLRDFALELALDERKKGYNEGVLEQTGNIEIDVVNRLVELLFGKDKFVIRKLN